MTRKASPVKERILSNIEIVTESGCWIWRLEVNNWGYGKIKIKGRTVSAHRASYSEFIGGIPDKLCVLHRCDVPSCVNPDHLFLGTHQDNSDDRGRKGRAKGAIKRERHGEANPNAKLTEKKVLEIRSSKEPSDILAKKYNVSSGYISEIKAGKKWSYLNE